LNWPDKPVKEIMTNPEIVTVITELMMKIKNIFLLIVIDKNFIFLPIYFYMFDLELENFSAIQKIISKNT
tara:strand:+ start:13 stop:222 length:210 start_codon:yes stop_codon:yes gene_type:complete